MHEAQPSVLPEVPDIKTQSGPTQAPYMGAGREHAFDTILALQRLAGNRATRTLLQREPSVGGGPRDALRKFLPPTIPRPGNASRQQSSTNSPAQPPPSARLPSSLRVRIVAHASPRWRSAQGSSAADKKNERLSRQRADTVRAIVDGELRDVLGNGADIRYEVEFAPGAEPEGVVTLGSEALGSRETLSEAKGDRSANASNQRRVDVFIDRIDRREEHAGRSTAPQKKTLLTTRWKIQPEVNASVVFFGGVGGISITLINADTGRRGFAHIKGLVGGFGGGVSVSASVGGDPVGFWTEEPMGFKDFAGQPVTFSSIAVGLAFVGWERARLSFDRLGSLAQGLDVGGWNVGAKLEAGITRLEGKLAFNNVPPDDDYVEPSKDDWVPYTATEQHGDLHTAFFNTGEWKLPPNDTKKLRLFIQQAAERFREP